MSKPVAVEASQFSTEVLKSSTPVLVDFWAPWCGPCRMIAPILEEMAAAHGAVLKVAKVNVDQNPQLASQYGVSGIPTLILFKDGVAADRIVGLLPRRQLEDRVLNKL